MHRSLCVCVFSARCWGVLSPLCFVRGCLLCTVFDGQLGGYTCPFVRVASASSGMIGRNLPLHAFCPGRYANERDTRLPSVDVFFVCERAGFVAGLGCDDVLSLSVMPLFRRRRRRVVAFEVALSLVLARATLQAPRYSHPPHTTLSPPLPTSLTLVRSNSTFISQPRHISPSIPTLSFPPPSNLTTKTQVVRARYGLDGVTAKTLDQIGREMGFTRERVRQIEAKALSKLRQPYRNYRVREHKTGQIFVDAGLREPASEAVSAARALIAEAEGLERQPPAVAAAAGCQPAVAAAGDRPLKIEFKPGVNASESTQAVEAVLVAALDRAPASGATASAAVAAVSKPNGSGWRKQTAAAGREGELPSQEPKVVGMAERSQPEVMLAEDEEPASLGRRAAATAAPVLGMAAADGLAIAGDQPPAVAAKPADGSNGRPAEGLSVPGVTLTPDSRRLLLDVESQQQGVAGRPESSTRVDDSSRLGVAAGGGSLEDDSVDVASGHERNGEGSGSSGSGPTFAVEPMVGVGVELPAVSAAALTPEERRAREIESKRKSLDKAWNKKSEAAVDRLERELAQSAAALAMLEMEQEEWERSVGDAVVEQKSLSMASL